MLTIVQPKSFVGAQTAPGFSLNETLAISNEFWRTLYAALTDNSIVQMKLAAGIDSEKTSNTAKMYGFVNTQISPEGVFAATKPAFKTGGVALKRNKKVA